MSRPLASRPVRLMLRYDELLAVLDVVEAALDAEPDDRTTAQALRGARRRLAGGGLQLVDKLGPPTPRFDR